MSNTAPQARSDGSSVLFLLAAVILTALAAGMGWGIRGQYGHESGAMIAGVLASSTLVMMFVPLSGSLTAARAAAMMTVAIGVGGSMTYGQTVGLTHDAPLLGNWQALRWGMIGLFVKGGIWIGLGSAFLGMGLGGTRYRPLEMFALVLGMIGLMFVGVWLLNSPFDPSTKTLPAIYFSDNWYFEPDGDLKPRREVWGGLLIALLGLLAYVRLVRNDRLAARMALVGMLAGGIGFPAGQALQAWHAWNPELFTEGALSWAHGFTQHFNWWNMMETMFGAVWGAGLALGLWCNRHLIACRGGTDDAQATEVTTIAPKTEIVLCAIHLFLLMTSEFVSLSGWAAGMYLYTELGLVMIALPLVGIVGGRLWPYLLLLPISVAPVAGKTLRSMSYQTNQVSRESGWLALVAIPLVIALVAALWLIQQSRRGQRACHSSATTLMVSAWIFFVLNTLVFQNAWPWKEWTYRTPNQVIFSGCIVALTVAALHYWRKPTTKLRNVLTNVSRMR